MILTLVLFTLFGSMAFTLTVGLLALLEALFFAPPRASEIYRSPLRDSQPVARGDSGGPSKRMQVSSGLVSRVSTQQITG